MTDATAKPNTDPSFAATRQSPTFSRAVTANVMPPIRIPSSQQRQASSNPAWPADITAWLAAKAACHDNGAPKLGPSHSRTNQSFTARYTNAAEQPIRV